MKEIIKKQEDDKLLLEVSNAIYDINALTNVSYKFTDKCFIYIDPISEIVVGVYFKSKPGIDIPLDEIAGNFCNELIRQQVRIDTEKKYANIRNAIVKQAFSPINPATE